MIDLTNNWWPEKWRPNTIDEYVGNDQLVANVRKWISEGEIPNLLFYSEKSGTGKTSIAKIIASSLDADVLYINASDENNVETIREKVKTFVSTMGFSRWKIVILDEFTATASAQAALNNIIESYSSVARFILTCNYIDKVFPSIRSRCTIFQVQTPPKVKVASRIAHILEQEGVRYTPEDVLKIVEWYYPDQRAMLVECHKCSNTGTLIPLERKKYQVEYLDNILEELKGGRSLENLRQIISNSRIKQFDDLFTFLYEKLNDYATESKHSMIIYHIADAQYKTGLVIDGQIQVANMFSQILKEL